MRRAGLIAFVSLLALSACSSSRSLEGVSERWVFLQRTTYAPEGVADVAGCYRRNDGFGGGVLELRTDSTYLRREWIDVRDSQDPVRGQEGDLRLFGDVVVLRFRAFVLDTTKAAERLEQAHQKANSLRRMGRADVYRLKKVRDTLFVVQPRLELLFAEQALENGGMPPYLEWSDGRRSSMFFFARTDSTLCRR